MITLQNIALKLNEKVKKLKFWDLALVGPVWFSLSRKPYKIDTLSTYNRNLSAKYIYCFFESPFSSQKQ